MAHSPNLHMTQADTLTFLRIVPKECPNPFASEDRTIHRSPPVNRNKADQGSLATDFEGVFALDTGLGRNG